MEWTTIRISRELYLKLKRAQLQKLEKTGISLSFNEIIEEWSEVDETSRVY